MAVAETFGQILQVSARTISRWEKRKSSDKQIVESDNVRQVEKIISLLRIYTQEGLRRFLSTPLCMKERSTLQKRRMSLWPNMQGIST